MGGGLQRCFAKINQPDSSTIHGKAIINIALCEAIEAPTSFSYVIYHILEGGGVVEKILNTTYFCGLKFVAFFNFLIVAQFAMF